MEGRATLSLVIFAYILMSLSLAEHMAKESLGFLSRNANGEMAFSRPVEVQQVFFRITLNQTTEINSFAEMVDFWRAGGLCSYLIPLFPSPSKPLFF